MIMTRKYIAEYKQKEHFSFTWGGMTSDRVGNQSFSMTRDLMSARDSVVIRWEETTSDIQSCFRSAFERSNKNNS